MFPPTHGLFSKVNKINFSCSWAFPLAKKVLCDHVSISERVARYLGTTNCRLSNSWWFWNKNVFPSTNDKFCWTSFRIQRLSSLNAYLPWPFAWLSLESTGAFSDLIWKYSYFNRGIGFHSTFDNMTPIGQIIFFSQLSEISRAALRNLRIIS